MTFLHGLGWSLSRSVVVTLLVLTLAAPLAAWLCGRRPGRQSLIAWGAVLLPLVTPTLMIGYCYRDTAVSLLVRPLLKELMYTALLTIQAVPVAVLMLWFSPPSSVSSAARHCGRQLQIPWRIRCWLWWEQRRRAWGPAAALVFLLSFQEAELGTLLQAHGWPEWLYTRHAGGLPLRESLRRAGVAAALQVPLTLPVLWWLSFPAASADAPEASRPPSNLQSRVAVSWITISLLLAVVIPGVQLFRGARQGWPALLEQPSTWRELGDAFLLALTSGGLALALAAWLMRGFQRRGGLAMLGAPLLLIPGLMGNLALGLFLATVFQTSPLRMAYDTPVPLILGETGMVLPRVVLLACCAMRSLRETGRHSLVLLSGSGDPMQRRNVARLDWRLRGRLWGAVAVLTMFWIFLEPVLSSLLAMPGLVPVGWVLYNSLHYGQISALGAKLALAMALFLLATVVAWLGNRVRLRMW